MTNLELARKVLHELELVWADRVKIGELENDTYAANRLTPLFEEVDFEKNCDVYECPCPDCTNWSGVE